MCQMFQDLIIEGDRHKSYNADYLGQIYAQWSTQQVYQSLNISFEEIQYNPQIGYTGRTYLINTKNWSIRDGGPI